VRLDLLVFAKEPVAGRSKTRLTPPFPPAGAAALAEAMLRDTLEVARLAGATRRLVVLDGRPGPWLPDGFTVLPQRGRGQAARLEAAFADAHAGSRDPALLIGMDTPQVTAGLLDACVRRLARPGTDAVLGRSADGGWWVIGVRRAVPGLFDRVPMSTAHTGAAQAAQLGRLGLRCAPLPVLRDVDTVEDAVAVAGTAPATRFAAVLRTLLPAAGTPPRPRVAAAGGPR
jgi:rSAM/selenodomain-associated transferase 1